MTFYIYLDLAQDAQAAQALGRTPVPLLAPFGALVPSCPSQTIGAIVAFLCATARLPAEYDWQT